MSVSDGAITIVAKNHVVMEKVLEKLSNAGGRLIIASDGIWDALSSDMAAQACRGLPAELAAKLVVKALRVALDSGKDLGMPDGVLINGKGPYQYNSTLVPDGINYETIKVDPGKTYRVRVHNVGVSTCLKFRIQNHNLLLAETEGYYVSQQNYT